MWLLTTILFLLCRYGAGNVSWPYCSNVTMLNGYPDVTSSIEQCIETIPSIMNPASYITGVPINVTISIALNNLVFVDEVEGKAKVDFYLRLRWDEPRMNISNLFDALNSNLGGEGIDLTDYYKLDQQKFPLAIFTPTIQFIDSDDTVEHAQAIRILPDGTMFWSRHISITVFQPRFDYSEYPLDSQVIIIRTEPYNYPDTMMSVHLPSSPKVFSFDASPISSNDFTTDSISYYYDPRILLIS